MAKCYREELVGVFGSPIDENPTVAVAEAAFSALGLNYRYLTVEVRPDDLEAAMKSLTALNFKGIHLTIPHKCEVLKYLDFVADDAALMGAVNTVYVKDGKLYGENTDGKGFLTSLKNSGTKISGTNIVVLGAGGAARAITVELANAGASKLTILNVPSEDKGSVLAALLNEKTNAEAEYIPWDHTYKIPADTDILVNATSIGLFPNVNDKANIDYDTITPKMVVCDVIPNHPHTAFLKEAEKRGAKTLDGLGMLIDQAAISFKFWTGRDCPIDVMKKALKAEFGVE